MADKEDRLTQPLSEKCCTVLFLWRVSAGPMVDSTATIK